MEAPRGAREPTGTNGPTLNNHPTNKPGWANQKTVNTLPQPLYKPRSTHTPTTQAGWGNVLNTQSCGGHSTGETPSNIPNLEAKPGSANGTATARLWESRTPPQHTSRRRASSTRMRPSAHLPKKPSPRLRTGATGNAATRHCGTCVLNDSDWSCVKLFGEV